VLGPDKFGLVAFAQAFAQYFVMLTDYGFNLSVTRNISINRHNKEKIDSIFSAVIFIKICLMILSLLLLCSITLLIPRFRQDFLLYLFSFGMVVGNVFVPVWFFQGMEKMKFITLANLSAKTLFLCGIFIFIRRKEDYLYVPLMNSLGFVAAGLMSLVIIFKNFKVRFKIPQLTEIIRALKDGWHIFLSTASITLYSSSNTLLLGLFTNNTIVGYYSAAEKIAQNGQKMFSPVLNSVYPYITKIASGSREAALRFISKILPVIFIVMFSVSLGICFLSPLIVRLLLGENFMPSVAVLRILSFIPFLVATGAVFANFFLLAFGFTKEWSKIIILSGLLSLAFTFLFVYVLRLAHIGAALSWVGTEIFVLIMSFINFKKYSRCR
jgi:PST family polysaccharide transporter